MRINHDIFNQPHAVKLTIEERKTPADYLRKDKSLGETMPMWRVQTEGYTDGTDQLIGLVSRDAGFEAPDTEWISSGVNTKSVRGVAIGRHGNFLQWGFAASPTYLTDEAKLVFINAVHYISRFGGQTPIIRKVAGAMPRAALMDAVKSASVAGHAETVAFYERFRERDRKRKKDIRERIERGEEVSKMDRRMLDYPEAKTPGRFSRVNRYLPKSAQKELGDDYEAIATYFRENLPYFHPSGYYRLEIDEELKRFGVGSAEPSFLDQAVVALADPERAELARKLLERYTTESFTTATEWSAWLETNRGHLLFSEVGGYKWFVGTRKAPAGKHGVDLKPSTARPLAAAMSVEPQGGGKFAVTVDIEILVGWHAYDEQPEGSAYTAVGLELKLPPGARRVGEWARPASLPSANDPAINIFEGRIAFSCEVAGAESADAISCKLTYQVCDEEMCLPTMTETLTTSSKVGAPPR